MFDNITTPRLEVKPRAVHETVFRSTAASNIIYISSDKTEIELRSSLQESIQAACHGEAAMPDLLWDKKGLQYFEDVTYTPSYYLTNEEIGILEKTKIQNCAVCPAWEYAY